MQATWDKIRQGDEELKKKLLLRLKIIGFIRIFFKERGFVEVDTPALVRYPGTEPHLDPLKTELKIKGRGNYGGYLITSPEYSIKKLLAAGLGNMFELAKCFRNNEPQSPNHNPEFLMLEWYRVNADYKMLMAETEELIKFLARQLFGREEIVYQGQKIDLSSWEKSSVRDLFLKFARIDLNKSENNAEKLAAEAKKLGYDIPVGDPFDDIFFKIFLNKIEPNLPKNKPIIIYDYPLPLASLARQNKKNPLYAERFEVYLGGLELANAFSELADPEEQRMRFEKEKEIRRGLGKEPDLLDGELLEALKFLPETAGIALGVDRLAMIFADAKTIDEILFFPANQIFK